MSKFGNYTKDENELNQNSKIKFEDIFEADFVKKIYDLCEKVNEIEKVTKLLMYKNFADAMVELLRVSDNEEVIPKDKKSFRGKVEELAKERNIKV